MLACVLVVWGSDRGHGVRASGPTPATTHSAGWVKVILCIGGAGRFVSGNAVLVLKIENVGGVIKFAKKLWNAKSAKARWC
ncbi:MAG: hypothetical protein QOD83_1204 [Solirubrobacteraceae bacterium]|jgi:hypothetical protein|nr:hypothetical protein [Solirubrobacteraceae bacterium]